MAPRLLLSNSRTLLFSRAVTPELAANCERRMDSMEPKEEEKKTRIYVGGLGEKVTSNDLMKIFSSLGVVKGEEIVRTKGRSFAYVDFYPSSDKSLSKLFSTYNGCVWKGGRLRLEKAKEHYLTRLKREWDEDTQPASSPPTECVDAKKDMGSSEKPKKVVDSDNNLHIFFPRLRKVKSLPFHGTGKHKYSFQRVEARPLPMYFCDCEEHFVPSRTAEGRQIHIHAAKEEKMDDLEAESGGMNQQELNLMNSVLNRLFERENVSKAASHGSGPAGDGHNSIKLIEDVHLGENEDESVADEDNLVINVVSKGNNRMPLLGCQEKTTISPINQTSTVGETRNPKGGRAQKVPESQKGNDLFPDGKRKSHLSEESVRNEFASTNSRGDMKRTPAQPAGTRSGVKQYNAECSWSQKLSWRALVGDKDSSVFNVSNILPVVESNKEVNTIVEPIENLQFDENDTEEDNIIINVVSKKISKKKLPGNQEQGTNLAMIQKPTVNETQTSEDRPVRSMIKVQKESTLPPKKKKKSLISEEIDRNKTVFTIAEGNGSLQIHSDPSRTQSNHPELGGKQATVNHSELQKSSQGELVGDKNIDAFHVSNVLPDDSADEEKPVSEGQNVPDSTNSTATYRDLDCKLDEMKTEGLKGPPSKTTNKLGSGSSWFQKSSWTQLVTEYDNSFSITQISPGITFKKHELDEPQGVLDTVEHTKSKDNNLVEQDKSERTRSVSTTVDNVKERNIAPNLPEKNQQIMVGNLEASTSVVDKNDSEQKRMPVEDVSIGETCSFMRSAASLKEWAKTKAVLSGSHKRKSNEK